MIGYRILQTLMERDTAVEQLKLQHQGGDTYYTHILEQLSGT